MKDELRGNQTCSVNPRIPQEEPPCDLKKRTKHNTYKTEGRLSSVKPG